MWPYIVSPSASRRRNSAQFAHSGTRLELAIRTRGAHGWVVNTPTGLPDWISSVSSSASVVSAAQIASKASHERAARPVPPYTTRSSGRSATSGSRLFISMRNAASVAHDRHVSVVPRGARTGRGPLIAASYVLRRSGHRTGPSTLNRDLGGHRCAVATLAAQIHRSQDSRPETVGRKRRRAPPQVRGRSSSAKSGGVLLSQGVYPQVPSALTGLTSVFGMGTGVTLSLWPPKISCQRGAVHLEDSRASTSCSIQALGRLVPVG